jgi:hypothetical protein
MTSLGIQLDDSQASKCVGGVMPVWSQHDLRRLDDREKGYQRVPLTLDQIQPVPYLSPELYYSEDDVKTMDARKQPMGTDVTIEDDDDWLQNWLEQSVQKKPAQNNGLQHTRTSSSQICVWTYVPIQQHWPDADFPIAQSYVDVILRGCLSYAPEMAHDFITSTKGWSCDSIDDDNDNSSTDSSDEVPSSLVFDSSSSNPGGGWLNDRHDPIYPRGDAEWSNRHAKTLDGYLQKHLPKEMAHRKLRFAKQ